MFHQQSFTHHGRSFTIEADDWPDEEAACAAIIDLQIWAMHLDPAQAAELHSALRQETESLVHETPFDRDTAPLPAVRAAQRQAIRAALSGTQPGAQQPTITIEAADVWAVQLAFKL